MYALQKYQRVQQDQRTCAELWIHYRRERLRTCPQYRELHDKLKRASYLKSLTPRQREKRGIKNGPWNWWWWNGSNWKNP